MRCPHCEQIQSLRARRCIGCGRSLEIAMLQVVEGEAPKTTYFLGPREYTIGRSPESDVPLPDASVSRNHARLVFEEGRFFIEDEESRHGVTVGSTSVKRAALESGSAIHLGRVTLEFRLVNVDASTHDALPPAARTAPGPASAGRSPADEALDHLQIGVVLVSRDGAVLFANRSARAILDEQDGLSLGTSGLRADDAETARELRRLLTEDTAGARGGGLSVPRRARRPLTVLVTVLGAESQRLPAAGAARAVFLSDPERGMATSEQMLQRLYRLTAAEARLAGELLRGKTLEEAAEELAVTLHTARSQLKSVFAKTGTHRQSELVRLLLAGPALLRTD